MYRAKRLFSKKDIEGGFIEMVIGIAIATIVLIMLIVIASNTSNEKVKNIEEAINSPHPTTTVPPSSSPSPTPKSDTPSNTGW